MMKIHQAVWGYSNGHRLLASSVPLTNQSTKILEPLSDLSGPEMISAFDGYLTGCPLLSDKYYALSKTWYANEMSRPGCVWTHTLFLDLESEECLQEIDLDSLFQRPNCAEADWKNYYTKPIEVFSQQVTTTVDAETHQTSIDVFSLVTEHLSPIVVSTHSNLLFNKALELLITEIGIGFFKDISFCTGSFSNRTISRIPLDLQIAPSNLSKLVFRSNQYNVFFADFSQHIVTHNNPDNLSLIEKRIFHETKEFILLFGSKYYRRCFWKPFKELYAIVSNLEEFSISSVLSVLNNRFDENDIPAIIEKSFEIIFSSFKYQNTADVSSLLRVLFDFFTVDSVFLNNSKCISSKTLSKILNSLWIPLHNQILNLLPELMHHSLNLVGEEAIKHIASLIEPNDYTKLLSKSPSICSVMIRFNWRLALCEDVWKQTKNIQTESLRELKNVLLEKQFESNEYLDIVHLIFRTSKFNLSSETYKTFGDCSIGAFFEWAEGIKNTNAIALKRWCNLCSQNQALSVDKLTHSKSVVLFESVIDVLDPYNDCMLLVSSSVWEHLYRQFCISNNSYTARTKYAEFVIPIILRSSHNFSNEFLTFAFSTVYKILANDNMDYCKWEKLSNFLPEVAWYNSWDKCKRLKKAIKLRKYNIDFET